MRAVRAGENRFSGVDLSSPADHNDLVKHAFSARTGFTMIRKALSIAGQGRTSSRVWRLLGPLILALVFLSAGCAERKTCYHSCYEESLDGYRDGSCGVAYDQTREECAAWICNIDDPPGRARTAWGEEPSWCKADASADD